MGDAFIAQCLSDIRSIPVRDFNECADVLLQALRRFDPNVLGTIRGADLLWERAAELKIAPQGGCSANQSCRLMATQDGYIAVNLARPEDWTLLPAWLEADVNNWSQLSAQVAQRSSALLLERGRLMGLAVATPNEAIAPDPVDALSDLNAHIVTSPLVVDMSALWAGPLCSHLLQGCGYQVIKVESVQRPDGAREGSPKHFYALHEGKECRRFDFRDPTDLRRLRMLLASADVVIEGSRPRALRALELDRESIMTGAGSVAAASHLWLSLTAYGRTSPFGDWVGFGDDVAIAAGAFDATQANAPAFIADAIADPLTGLLAAWLILQLRRRRMSGLIDFSLFRAANFCVNWLQDSGGALVSPTREPTLRC